MKEIKGTIKRIFWQDRVSLLVVVSGLIFSIANFVILKLQIKPDYTAVIIHYNVFFGIDDIRYDLSENYLSIFIFPAVALSIWLINLVLGTVLYHQVISDRSKLSQQEDKKRKKSLFEKDYFLDYLDAKMLASYLIWGSALVVQLCVLVYVVAVIIVNK